ncbi:UDP-N-acetylglucosamine 1-carboxyvinyltransferase [Patescibacteria group bacterium]|nr:UDP-N-acetylglucosamine 1-carboxyvinyltransferase [Patescibacteria group bacterium]
MAKYIIEGGMPLRGSVKVTGAKNAGFKLMIASLLSDETSTLSSVPFVRDVIAVKKIIEALGAKIDFSEDTMQIKGRIAEFTVPEELGIKSRASFMYLPVLLHRFKKGKVTYPVGDKIGERPINWFLEGLAKMGVSINKQNSIIEAQSPRGLVGCEYEFPKNSHTGTEALIMAAVFASGETKIKNAAAEPEVDDLILFLNRMGAGIERIKPREIKIKGVSSLHGATHKVMPDRNEVVTFGCIALGTGGEIEIENANTNHVNYFLRKVKEAGGNVGKKDNKLTISYQGPLKSTNITTAPFPGFLTDWQSLWVALMTQAEGSSIIHETIFENRFDYVPFLTKMGAEIELYRPSVNNPDKTYNFDWDEQIARVQHAAKVFGPRKLHGSNLEVTDIRAGATLVFAALMAQGKSEIDNIEHIERGYGDLEGRLERLGAKISRVN